eukprot:TRINITY_DN3578_c2_g1_i1.p1 TRINITY_DN3578_c2_g1~~TRINITY_DN3578_c2_g1_i1.p1  ORF type:complete len:970 (+),score=365.74 TRINITY_DN3578_c2_g1_i1:62-2971(+)
MDDDGLMDMSVADAGLGTIPREDTYTLGKSYNANRPTLNSLRNTGKFGVFTNLFTNKPEAESVESDDVQSEDQKAGKQKKAVKFGMWDGVLARVILNIFGVILFLRLGWIVGYAGIGFALVLIMTSVICTTLTAMSLSSICTNGIVEGGGAYYMISRSLGPEYGGSIGLMFYAANAVALALYLVGFAETITEQVDGAIFDEDWDLRIISLITLVVLLIICFCGVDWVIKIQLALLFLLLFSIASFIIGALIHSNDDSMAVLDIGLGDYCVPQVIGGEYSTTEDICVVSDFLRNFGPEYDGQPDLFPEGAKVLEDEDGSMSLGVLLGIFFPAVTGVMAGANISGDLKDPSKAIPKGTLSAIGFTTIVYVILAILLGLTVARQAPTTGTGDDAWTGLVHDSILMAKMSVWPPLVYAGIYAATISSAIASLVGAPRILQAVGKDGLFGFVKPFEKGYGASNEPIRAYLLTFTIATICVLGGDLNFVAPLVSTVFLASYALSNYACFAAASSKSPGWRPTFKYSNKWTALAGCIMSVFMMMFLSTMGGIITIIVGFCLYKYVESCSKTEVNWGAANEGQRYRRAVKTMLTLGKIKEHIKNWRPQWLMMTGDVSERRALGWLARSVRKGRGLVVFGDVNNEDYNSIKHKANIEKGEKFLESNKIEGFMNVSYAKNLKDGTQNLLQLSGLGSMRPNTVCFGFRENWLNRDYIVKQLEKQIETRENEEMTSNGTEEGEKEKVLDEVTISMTDALATDADVTPEEREKLNEEYVESIGSAFDNDCGVVVLRNGHKFNDLCETMHASKAKKGCRASIDVWWLVDDGGFTPLLPHIMCRGRIWSGTKLRLLTVAKNPVAIAAAQIRMESMMKKFRIDYEIVPVLNEAPTKPSQNAIEEVSRRGIELDDQQFDQCNFYIRLGELIKEHSSDASLVVVTLPVPRADQDAKLYMSYLEMMSTIEKPVFMMRGNQNNVLTIYS